MLKGPKLREFAAALGNRKAKDKAIGLLVSLWIWGLDNADENGKLFCADQDDIEDAICRYTEIPPDLVVKALFDTGWLEKDGDDIFIHDWAEWQEQWYKAKKRREADRESKYQKRHGIQKEADCKKESSNEDKPIQLQFADNENDLEHPEEPAHKQPKEPKPEQGKKKNNNYTPQFEEIWDTYYGERGAKAEGYNAYKARLNDGWTHQQLLQAAQSYSAQEKRRGTEKQYVKRMKTFFGPNTPFVDFLPNKGSLKVEDIPENPANPYSEYEEEEL